MSIRKSVIKIKGRPASPGVGIGKVKIVSTLQDFRSFESGDILVTEMTHPNMVIIMLKAAAIVTDIGGLTCHAAILSRELGIPCVVATKLATKLLKTGMVVEVNGTTGEIHQIIL